MRHTVNTYTLAYKKIQLEGCLRRITNLIIIIAMPASSAHKKSHAFVCQRKSTPELTTYPFRTFFSFWGSSFFPSKAFACFPPLFLSHPLPQGEGGEEKGVFCTLEHTSIRPLYQSTCCKSPRAVVGIRRDSSLNNGFSHSRLPYIAHTLLLEPFAGGGKRII